MGEQLPAERQFVFAVLIGEKAGMTDTPEIRRQNVDQETADKTPAPDVATAYVRWLSPSRS